MAEKIIMPKQGLQMTEGTIVEWLVPEGGRIVEGEPLFIIETDKVTITIDALVSGTLLKILAKEGDVVPVTGIVAIAGEPGEDISALTGVPGRVFISPRAKMRAEELGVDYLAVHGSGQGSMIVERDIIAAAQSGSARKDSAASGPEKPAATPLAKKIALQSGLDLADIQGSGSRGKITRSDVVNSIKAKSPAGERRIVPMRGMRKIIAERMKQSQNENAQTFHRVSVRMDEAVRLRQSLDKTVGYNDLIAFASVRALKDFPEINAELTAEGIWQKDFVNLGIAVAMSGGLIVPVVHDAQRLTLAELASEIKALAEKARNNALQPDDYTGGSFTISNLGMYGLEEFAAIINPPEAGILAAGKIEETPIAVNGNVEIHPVMKLTLTYDHRIIDGAPAAQFLVRIKEYLENPYRLL
ncbi:MAG: 2-oxo acid dehydrogenase subunit E2 [Treponema sp.]|jgi:pyruvate dehydrogenase E2 component (dihydrolipoamide acetyltransferase)|nr:2-oxo acid dehydrogenase subunit E2 [Treponema sp.]